jgi:hypothetical protein
LAFYEKIAFSHSARTGALEPIYRNGVTPLVRKDLTQKMSTFFALGINQGILKTTENSAPTSFVNPIDLGSIKFTGYQFLLNGSYAL